MRTILFIMIGISWLYAGDMVRDSATGLVWQDNEAAKSVKKSWSGAKSYCRDLTLGGHSDWRLPTIKELQSIVDIRKYDPAIKNGFRNVASYLYWSSSVSVSDSSEAWSVFFDSGRTNSGTKSCKGYVRCVRGRQ